MSNPAASITCLAVHSAVGCSVTLVRENPTKSKQTIKREAQVAALGPLLQGDAVYFGVAVQVFAADDDCFAAGKPGMAREIILVNVLYADMNS